MIIYVTFFQGIVTQQTAPDQREVEITHEGARSEKKQKHFHANYQEMKEQKKIIQAKRQKIFFALSGKRQNHPLCARIYCNRENAALV